MPRKRIAIVVPGGVGNGFYSQGVPALVNLINGLSEQFEVTVYSLIEVSDTFRPENFKIKSVKTSRDQPVLWRMLSLCFIIWKDHKKQSYDLFHGIWAGPSGMLAVFLGKLLIRPSVVSLQGGETAAVEAIPYGHMLKPGKKRWLFRTLRAASQVTTLTEFQSEILRKYGFTKNIKVTPIGVDTQIFVPVEKEFGPSFNFLHVANLTEVKDQETLLRAFRRIKDSLDCHLRIAGADYMEGRIQKLCKELNLEDYVTFLGPVKNTDLPQHFGWAHALIHTSLYEAQGVVIVEAAACKVLIAGTRTGIISDLQNETVSVAPGDHQGLAEKVLNIASHQEQWEVVVQKAYQWATENDIRFTVNSFADIYNHHINS
ncbi:glycosyltransferase family 4 protein [Fulvivirga sp. 29W222]|uniref:Glycosyltransferase family 4 protein n=1 Tax=Fulvivirga marina TaxID=2494733 RepID=A0A937G190_9BACT|nr:glycosyltransferase family 4 protein [Fulvivirga marina]MBL6449804.1 glycosyltransferase family 4 protein [Fulvivirga marina]